MVRILGGDHDGTFLAFKTKPQGLYRGPLGPPSQIPSHGRVPLAVVIMVVVAVVTVLVVKTVRAIVTFVAIVTVLVVQTVMDIVTDMASSRFTSQVCHYSSEASLLGSEQFLG